MTRQSTSPVRTTSRPAAVAPRHAACQATSRVSLPRTPCSRLNRNIPAALANGTADRSIDRRSPDDISISINNLATANNLDPTAKSTKWRASLLGTLGSSRNSRQLLRFFRSSPWRHRARSRQGVVERRLRQSESNAITPLLLRKQSRRCDFVSFFPGFSRGCIVRCLFISPLCFPSRVRARALSAKKRGKKSGFKLRGKKVPARVSRRPVRLKATGTYS